MVGQTDFLLIDVELLNVVYELLLQTVVVHLVFRDDLVEIALDSSPDFLDPLLFVLRHLERVFLNEVYMAEKVGCEGLTLLLAEADEVVDGLADAVHDLLPLVLVKLRLLHLDDVGQRHYDAHEVRVARHGVLLLDGGELLIILPHGIGIDASDPLGLLRLAEHGKVDLAATNPACEE